MNCWYLKIMMVAINEWFNNKLQEVESWHNWDERGRVQSWNAINWFLEFPASLSFTFQFEFIALSVAFIINFITYLEHSGTVSWIGQLSWSFNKKSPLWFKRKNVPLNSKQNLAVFFFNSNYGTRFSSNHACSPCVK